MKSKLSFYQTKELIKEARTQAPFAKEFIESCDKQLNARGFLTKAQVQGLQNVRDNTRREANAFDDYYRDFHDPDGFWDMDDDFDPFDP